MLRYKARMQTLPRTALLTWLGLTALLVFLMVVVGGLTRLTESGLSIVEWKPVTGTFPPMSAEAWQEEFAKYKQSPQYLKVNQGMSVEQFKGIFWLEYLHRLLGRLIGLVFFAPLLYFIARKEIPPSLKTRLVFIFILGGMQGVIGWYMVKSGLVDEPYVSPIRLAFHLCTAFILFALIQWSWLDIAGHRYRIAAPKLKRGIIWLTGLVFVQIMLGAFVAGNDAGLTYNTFPLMDGHIVPPGLWTETPWIHNFFHNVTMVQFNHRVMAYIVTLATLCYAWQLYRHGGEVRFTRNAILLAGLIAIQFSLGIETLLNVVPIHIASLHQAFALILFAACVMIWHGFSGAPLETAPVTSDNKNDALGNDPRHG